MDVSVGLLPNADAPPNIEGAGVPAAEAPNADVVGAAPKADGPPNGDA